MAAGGEKRRRVIDPRDGRTWVVGETHGVDGERAVMLVDPVAGDWLRVSEMTLAGMEAAHG